MNVGSYVNGLRRAAHRGVRRRVKSKNSTLPSWSSASCNDRSFVRWSVGRLLGSLGNIQLRHEHEITHIDASTGTALGVWGVALRHRRQNAGDTRKTAKTVRSDNSGQTDGPTCARIVRRAVVCRKIAIGRLKNGSVGVLVSGSVVPRHSGRDGSSASRKRNNYAVGDRVGGGGDDGGGGAGEGGGRLRWVAAVVKTHHSRNHIRAHNEYGGFVGVTRAKANWPMCRGKSNENPSADGSTAVTTTIVNY